MKGKEAPMNKLRRKELTRIIEKLERLEALRLEIKDELEAVLEEEQEAFDNLPESLQESERGQQMQEYIDAMDGALDELDAYDHDSVYAPLFDII
jgi:ATP-dependent helicase/DNAse subunit B